MIVIDASVWIARTISTDFFHSDSKRLFNRLFEQGETLAIPDIALIEIAGAVPRISGDFDRAIKVVEAVQSLSTLQCHASTGRMSQLAIAIAASQRMRGADAVYVALARELEAQLISWDVEQVERSQPLVHACNPIEFLQRENWL